MTDNIIYNNEHSTSQGIVQDADNVYDIYGTVINVGSTVRYVNTGTIGKVKELLIIDGIEWARLPASDIKSEMDLMYNVGYLEVVDAKATTKAHARTLDLDDLAKENSKGAGVDLGNISAPGGAG